MNKKRLFFIWTAFWIILIAGLLGISYTKYGVLLPQDPVASIEKTKEILTNPEEFNRTLKQTASIDFRSVDSKESDVSTYSIITHSGDQPAALFVLKGQFTPDSLDIAFLPDTSIVSIVDKKIDINTGDFYVVLRSNTYLLGDNKIGELSAKTKNIQKDTFIKFQTPFKSLIPLRVTSFENTGIYLPVPAQDGKDEFVNLLGEVRPMEILNPRQR